MAEDQANEASEAGETDDLRRVGAVARLTGLSTHSIRAWERRYGAVKPRRAESGLRLYSQHDILRLQLMKALTDQGEQISLLANLNEQQLRQRLSERFDVTPFPVEGAELKLTRLALVDRQLSAQIEANPADLLPLEVVAERDSVESLIEAHPGADFDILVIEMEALGEDFRGTLTACRERWQEVEIWVSYSFAPLNQLRAVIDFGAHLVRLPLRLAVFRDQIGAFPASRKSAQLKSAAASLDDRGPHDLSQAAPTRLFTNEQLARLREMPSGVGCECNTQLSSLVAGLIAFEEYSSECESKNSADAALHQFLAKGTGMARALMEELLQRLCEEENIQI